MTTRRMDGVSFVLGRMCIALLLVSVSSTSGPITAPGLDCSNLGNCPNEKACDDYCAFHGFVQGGRCYTDGFRVFCCCISTAGSPHSIP
ncbi:hypothetical protein VNO78_25865 [Psophocarpus tetragonolobus]|uniref:Uncharacterized protein n=1 Tax=Psophocarpus tetragonolobus TaxID=3891 RepID=A0AAN9XFT8_PSOTE